MEREVRSHLESLERVIARERPSLLCVTPNFQNPTGATMPLSARQALLRITRAAGVTVIGGRYLRTADLRGRAGGVPEAAGRDRRYHPSSQFFQSGVPWIARGLGGGAARP